MILFYLLITTMPLVEHPFWGRYVGEMTITKYLGAVCLLYSLFHLAIRGSVPSYISTRHSRYFLVFVTIVLISFATNGRAFSLEGSPLITYASFVFLFLITMTIVDSASRLRSVLLVIIGSVAWVSIYVLREWQKGILIYGFSYRPGWITGDGNFFAGSVMLAMPLAAQFILQPQKRGERVFASVCALTSLAAFTVSASRGGLFALGATAFFLAYTSRMRVKLILLLCIVAAVMLLLPSSPLPRLRNPNASDIESTQIRLELWNAAIQMIVEHPLSGIGLGNFAQKARAYTPTAEEFHVAHNTYLEIAAEMGIPALLAFVTMLGSTLLSLDRLRRTAARTGCALLNQAASGIEGGIIAFAVTAFFMSAWWNKLFWFYLFLSMCLGAIHEQLRSMNPDETPESDLIQMKFTDELSKGPGTRVGMQPRQGQL